MLQKLQSRCTYWVKPAWTKKKTTSLFLFFSPIFWFCPSSLFNDSAYSVHQLLHLGPEIGSWVATTADSQICHGSHLSCDSPAPLEKALPPKDTCKDKNLHQDNLNTGHWLMGYKSLAWIINVIYFWYSYSSHVFSIIYIIWCKFLSINTITSVCDANGCNFSICASRSLHVNDTDLGFLLESSWCFHTRFEVGPDKCCDIWARVC